MMHYLVIHNEVIHYDIMSQKWNSLDILQQLFKVYDQFYLEILVILLTKRYYSLAKEYQQLFSTQKLQLFPYYEFLYHLLQKLIFLQYLEILLLKVMVYLLLFLNLYFLNDYEIHLELILLQLELNFIKITNH